MRRAVPWLVALLGGALVVAGVVVFAAADRGLAGSGSAAFGWAAYAPLQETQSAYQSAITFTDRATVLWTGAHLLGAGLMVLGLLVLVGLGGWLLGRRSGRRTASRA